MSDSSSVHFRNRETLNKKNSEEKYNNSNGSSSTVKTKNGTSSQDKKLDMNRSGFKKNLFIWIPVSIFLITFYYITMHEDPRVPKQSVNWWDENVHLKLGFQKKSYAVIIDAGSTGSRVLAFSFHQSLRGISI